MLAVSNVSIALQVFFNNSQHNFTRHWCESVGSVTIRIFFLPLLENWNICQLPVNWELSRFPGPLENNWDLMLTSASSLSILGWISLGPMDLHASRWSSKFCASLRLAGSWSVLQSWSSNSRHLGCQSSWSGVKAEAKEAWNICFVYVPLCKMTVLIK